MEINSFKWIGGATWVLNLENIKIACDPVLCSKGHVQNYGYFKSTRLTEPVYSKDDFSQIDIWLLSHAHEDHIDAKGLSVIDTNSRIISHKSLKKILRNYKNVNYQEWHSKIELNIDDFRVVITAIPAYHAKKIVLSPLIGNGNGYLIEINKTLFSYNIYVTGDSVFNNNIPDRLKNMRIDLAIVNCGSAMIGDSALSKFIGRITNNSDDLNKLVLSINPQITIPVHWGTFSHYKESILADSIKKNSKVKVISEGEIIRIV